MAQTFANGPDWVKNEIAEKFAPYENKSLINAETAAEVSSPSSVKPQSFDFN